MDIIRDLKLRRKRNEPGSEKRSPDNTSTGTEENEMAEDLRDLPEFDYENPEMKVWMEQEEARQRQTLANVKREDVVAFVDQLVRSSCAVKTKT